MIKAYWDKLSTKVDALSLRERVLIFAAAAFLLVSLVNTVLLDPLFARQKTLSAQVVQQQEKIKELHAQIEGLLQSKRAEETSPLRLRLNELHKQLAEGEAYLKERKDRLVPPENMPALLEQVLAKSGHLQLVKLQTLPVAPLVGGAETKQADGEASLAGAATLYEGKQVFKHGVQITVRGRYAEMLDYLAALEALPTQMYWGMVQMNVIQYPVAEFTLTVYTISLDKTWLRV